MDSRFGVESPFNSVHKINAIVKRGRGPAQIVWCFCSLADKVLSGAKGCATFSLRALRGGLLVCPFGGGQVDIFLYRLKMMQHLGHVHLENLQPSPQIRQKYWEVFGSHAAYRANMTAYNPAHKLDRSWMAGWPRSMISFFEWVEDMIFIGEGYSMALRSATPDSPMAFMDHHTVGPKWQDIIDARHDELQYAAKEATAAAAAQEPEAAPCAAGSADAAALARPSNGNDDAAATDDTAAKGEAHRMVNVEGHLTAAIIIEPDNGDELRNQLLSSTAGNAMGQHALGKWPRKIIIILRTHLRARAPYPPPPPPGQVRPHHLRLQAGVRGQGSPTPVHPTSAAREDESRHRGHRRRPREGCRSGAHRARAGRYVRAFRRRQGGQRLEDEGCLQKSGWERAGTDIVADPAPQTRGLRA